MFFLPLYLTFEAAIKCVGKKKEEEKKKKKKMVTSAFKAVDMYLYKNVRDKNAAMRCK